MTDFASAAEAADWIQGARHQSAKAGLENMLRLLQLLGNPERGLQVLHVAGTNGKGSTCAMLERVLRCAGFATGLYTSPYLCRYNERVRINGRPISDQSLVEYSNRLWSVVDHLAEESIYPTAFELGTALAYMAFRDAGVERVVLEVGMGGRLDSTNTVTPLVCVAAAIGMDHMSILGDTLEKIAYEKAGILKPGVPAVVMPQSDRVLDVFRRIALEKGAPLIIAPVPDIQAMSRYGSRFQMTFPDGECREFTINLPGEHQARNAALALSALDTLGIDRDVMARALSMTVWPGRLEWLDGILLDGAHNPQGAQALYSFLHGCFPMERFSLVTGMMKDKQPQAYADLLAPLCAKVFAAAVEDPRAVPPPRLAEIYRERGAEADAFESISEALKAARAGDHPVVVAGSLYLVGAIREMLGSDDGSI